jgi:hypothetical protein
MPAAVVFKAISPKKFKDDAFLEEVYAAMDTVADGIKSDYDKTTVTWKNKPKFEIIENISNKGPEVLVGTDDDIFKFVDEGTKEHIILPKTAKRLRFQNTYTAKTVPGVIGSRSGGPSGDVVFSNGVIHPGTEARNFTKIIEKTWQGKFKRIMEKAISNAAKKSGHAI